MSYLRYALVGILLALAVMVALANVGPVTVALLPDTLAEVVGHDPTVTLPLFVVLGAAIGLGLVLGLVWEWWRERTIRREAARARRELEAMEQGGRTSRARGPRDEILEIVDGSDRRPR